MHGGVLMKGKEVVFQNVDRQEGFTLRNQERELYDFEESDIESYLDDMLITPEQFVVLTAPAAQNQIRFVQATVHPNGEHFYHNAFNPDKSAYQPVKFL